MLFMHGNVKITCGLKWVEDQEEQKKKCSKPQKLVYKDQLLSLEYFAQSSSAGNCHPLRSPQERGLRVNVCVYIYTHTH